MIRVGLYLLDFLYCISCIVFLVPLLVPNYEKACGITLGFVLIEYICSVFISKCNGHCDQLRLCFDPFK